MAYIADLNGKILDYNGNPIEGARISVYRKVGEILSDENGDYSNIQYNETEEYIVGCEKDEYYTKYEEYPLNGLLNISMLKDDGFVEPPVPSIFQVVDYETGDSVLISWSDISFDFIAGYNIYRSDSLQGVFEKINENIIVGNDYIDDGLQSYKEYFYILEVVSANSCAYMQGMISRTIIAGPVSIEPIVQMTDITDYVEKIKVDSTKTNREAQKIFDENDETWWESQRGANAWIELIFADKKNINGFYFKRVSVGKGVFYARLQYWNYDIDDWTDIQKLDYFIDIEHTFENFVVNTDRIRMYIDQAEPLSETQISKIVVYGE